MARYHGITQNTYERFLIDSGEVRMGFVSPENPGTLLGATRGGATFNITTEYKDMAVDGAKGPVQGGRRITKVEVKLAATFVEWSTDLIKLTLPGSTETLSDDHDVISRSLQLTDANYLSNVAIIGQISGSTATGPGILIARRVICTAPFDTATTDNEEAVLKVEFTGHFSPTDLDTEPWQIWWAHDSNPTTTTTVGA